MRFLAIQSERQPAPEVWSKYVHKENVNCRKCGQSYQLWAPLECNDDAMVQSEAGRLRAQLVDDCPGHPDWFHLQQD
jgi:hypothetical protein